MSASFIFQPKPEGDRHVQVHISYKRITDGKESTAALLSVLEYLAKQSLLNSGTWSIGDPIPSSIPIQGDCNNPRLNRLLDDWLKPTSLRSKLHYFEEQGFISLDTSTHHRRRFVTYHYGAIASALSQLNLHPPKNDPSKSEASKNEVSESGGSRKCGLTPQKVEPNPSLFEASAGFRHQKVDPSRSLDPDLLAEEKADPSQFSFFQREDSLPSPAASVEPSPPPPFDLGVSGAIAPQPSEQEQRFTTAVKTVSMSQAEFELLTPVQQQASRLKGEAIALDPWIINDEKNQANVLAGRAFRCELDAGFTEYLCKQLGKSPYWQKRPDAPPKNAGVRIIKELYAIADPAGRDAERERLVGEWDKYQGAIARRQQNKQLRASASPHCAVDQASASHPSEEEYVPFSQAPLEVQQALSRFRRKSSLVSVSDSARSDAVLSSLKNG